MKKSKLITVSGQPVIDEELIKDIGVIMMEMEFAFEHAQNNEIKDTKQHLEDAYLRLLPVVGRFK